MGKVAWFLDQSFSFYRLFQTRARNDFGLVHRVSAVTMSWGHDIATPACSAHAHVLPHVSGYDFPSLTATGSVAWSRCCCSHDRAALQPASPHCRTADLPRVATQPLPMSSYHRRVRACPLCLYPAAGPIRCRAHVAKIIVALPLMALRPRGPCRSMDACACPITSTRA